MKKNHDIFECSAVLLHETDKAYLFDTGEIDSDRKAIGVWVPKSQCEYTEHDCCLQMPEWLAIEKGFADKNWKENYDSESFYEQQQMGSGY